MKVKDVMTQSVACCPATSNIGEAVELMWVRNCGMLPVIGEDKKLVGIITDRDICIALATRNRLAGDLTVGEIAIQNVATCAPEDEIHLAVETMANAHVRRLPVVDGKGMPVGVLSMDDVIRHADLNRWEGACELAGEEVIRSLKILYGQKFPVIHTKKVAA